MYTTFFKGPWRSEKKVQIRSTLVIIVPPDGDGLTDEEFIGNEEETDDVMIQDVPGFLELRIETDHQNELYSDLR